MQDGHLTNKSRTYSFHRRAAGSSRRGLTGTWGSRVPPGHSRGHTGKWCEPPGPARCGTWSSSRSGSLANLGTSHFGTPLWKEKEKKKIKQTAMEVFRGVYSAAFRGSREGPWGEHRYISFRRDAATHSSACEHVARRLMHLLYARLTVWQNDGFHLSWTAFKYHRRRRCAEEPFGFQSQTVPSRIIANCQSAVRLEREITS